MGMCVCRRSPCLQVSASTGVGGCVRSSFVGELRSGDQGMHFRAANWISLHFCVCLQDFLYSMQLAPPTCCPGLAICCEFSYGAIRCFLYVNYLQRINLAGKRPLRDGLSFTVGEESSPAYELFTTRAHSINKWASCEQASRTARQMQRQKHHCKTPFHEITQKKANKFSRSRRHQYIRFNA